MAVRRPARAGEFYDAEPEELKETVEACFLGPYGPGRIPFPAPFRTADIVGLVSPHAGLTFSGYAAATSYAELADDGLPATIVLIGPNHFGVGAPAAIVSSGQWATPLGLVEIDNELAEKIMENSEYVKHDPLAHQMEHSLEVQLPFIQYIAGTNIRIVPISIAHLSDEDGLALINDLGDALAEALPGTDSVIVASTDFTHYEPKSVAQRKDEKAIEKIEHLDWNGLMDVVRSEDISMCGAVPTAITVYASRKLGAKQGELLTYYTSGDIMGDTRQVVGYGSLKLTRGL